MAVYTHVDQAQLAEFIAQYDIGDLKTYKGIAEGVENTNYLLETSVGRYILTLFEQRTPVADLPFFLNLKQHLSDRGIPCPLPLLMKSGKNLGQLAGRAATIVSFLEGKSLSQANASHCRQVGEILGEMHLAGQSFGMRRQNGLDLPAWRPLFEKSGKRSDEVQSGLANWIEQELDFLESHWPTGLPTGVIHADLFRDNVFFDGDRLTGVIDFYFSCTDLLAYDLAITVNAWCFEKQNEHFELDTEMAQSLIEGYQSKRRLESPEAESFPILCRGAALRFLLTRLYDWLNVPPDALTIPHDPKEYIDKLKFHQTAARLIV